MGEAVIGAGKEVALFYVGGIAVKVILKGGRYLYVAYRANQAAKATNAGTEGLKIFGSLTEKFGEGYKSIAVAQGKHLPIELGKKLNNMSPGSWSKVYEAGILNGSRVEVHYFYNATTGQYANPFIKMGEWGSKALKGLK